MVDMGDNGDILEMSRGQKLETHPCVRQRHGECVGHLALLLLSVLGGVLCFWVAQRRLANEENNRDEVQQRNFDSPF